MRSCETGENLAGYTRKRRFFILALVAIAGLAVALWFSAPRPLPASALPPHAPDVANGERLFHAAGCASCHAGVENKERPAGGRPLATPVGTFYPPNLTPDAETGLGEWREVDFINAVLRGITPQATHYFPAFPYASYQGMRIADALDILAYLKTLEPVRTENRAQGVPLGFLVRPFIGLWKRMAMDYRTFTPDPAGSQRHNRGAYLVRAVGRCGECHTPRNLFFVTDESRYLKGGPHPDGSGKVPDITGSGEPGKWSRADLVSVFKTGFKPDFSDDISSGGMDAVLKGLQHLDDDDLMAIADYLKSLK